MKTLERIALALGALLLAWLVHRIGLRTVLETVGRVGWGFAAVVGLYAITALLNTLAWRATSEPTLRVPTPVLLGFLLAGDAVNAVTPSAVVGGELVRIGLLRRKMPAAAAAASVSLAAVCQFLAQLGFVLAALPIVARETFGHRFETALLFVGLAAAALFLGILFALLRCSGVFGWVHERLARRFPSRFDAASGSQWRSLDDAIFRALRDRPAALVRSFLRYFAGWTMGAVETALVLWLLGAPLPFRQCIAIEALAIVLDTVLFIVPARLGTQEGGKYAIFRFLHLDPALGFALGLVRRLRELVWAVVGLAVLAWWQRKRELPRAETEPGTILEDALLPGP